MTSKYLILLSFLLLFSCSKETELLEDASAQLNLENEIGNIEEAPLPVESSEEQGKKNIVISNRADENAAKPRKDSKGYFQFGVWEQSVLLGHKQTVSRYSSDPSAYIEYKSSDVKDSRYCVSVFSVTHANSIDQASFKVYDNDNILATIDVDQRKSIGGEWVHLGEYRFSSGEAKIALSRGDSSNNGFLRADDIRLKRLKDGFDCLGKIYATVKKNKILDNRKDENSSSSKKDTAGYREAGEWHQSVLKGYKDTISRYSFASDAQVTYRASVEERDYCLRFFRVTHSNSSRAVKVNLKVNGQIVASETFDYSMNNSESGWVSFGVHRFAAGDDIEVTFSKQDPNDSDALRSDALQFTTKLKRCEI